MKSTDEILRVIPDEHDGVTQIIYQNVFMRDASYLSFESAFYQAPETKEYFALRVCQDVSNRITELFDN